MFDVIFVADIYVPGGTNYQLAQNIRHLWSSGRRVGIIPVSLPHAKGAKAINRFVRQEMSDGHCEVVDRALSAVRTRHLLIDNPRLMTAAVKLPTKVMAEKIVVLVPFPPQDGAGRDTFQPSEVLEAIAREASGEVTWAPVSNLVRDQLKRRYPDLPLTELNAHPIVEASSYPFASKLRDTQQISIGRHSRPEPDKWPGSRSHFLKVYPASSPFSVSLLGIDRASLSTLIGKVPGNYRVLPYDSMPVRDFLRTIDFFVYFHHTRWIEAFGIVVAEAMASGNVCVLPRYMAANFGEAALYATPNEVRDVLTDLHRRPRKFAEQARFARNFVKREFSAMRFAEFADEIGICPARKTTTAPRRRRHHDAVYLLDLSSPKVFNRALVDEVVRQTELGARPVVADVRHDAAGGDPSVESALAGVSRLVEGPVTCEQLFISDPWRAVVNGVDLRRFGARQITCLASYPHGDLAAIKRYFSTQVSAPEVNLSWAPSDAQTRIWLESFDPNLRLSAINLAPSPSAATVARVNDLRSKRPITVRRTIGLAGIETPDDVKWVNHLAQLLAGSDPIPILTCYGERPKAPEIDGSVSCTGYRGIDLTRWVAKLDRLILVRDQLKADNLDYLVALCRSVGVPVLYRWRFNKDRAAGAISLEGCRGPELRSLVLGELNAPERSASAPESLAAVSDMDPTFAPGKQRERRSALLFVSQNGTGVGHVVRQLAIARRLASDHDCVFLTMSQAVQFIASFGFHAEYFPSSVYSGVSYTDWLHWLRRKVDLMLDAWDVRTVVFDGNVPYASVIEAAAASPDVRSIWIRRGMWPDTPDDRRRLRSQIYFDMIIEPRDFAEDRDEGPTRPLRDTVHLVPPIQLLGDDELVSRVDACAALGMDPETVNVLIQLGSGNNRDLHGAVTRIAHHLGAQRGVRLYNLRWPISDVPATPFPGVKDLAIFPIARFYRAFDFSISAAGYNTAHEVLGHRLPTVFLPNTTEGMDNQSGRASHSAAQGLSISATPATLGPALDQMLDADVRNRIRRRLRRLALENGAHAAAGLIREMTRRPMA